jgi:tetratricopeptide (TPR) repeat protein
MARRKRLNKKVAIVGVTVLAALAALAVLALATRNRDPRKLLQEADAALAAGDYDGARRGLSRAFDLATDPNARVELLFKMAEVYRRAEVWPKVLGCWERIIQEDPQNIKARLVLLDARALQADGQARLGVTDTGVWKDVETRAGELLDVVTRTGAAGRDRAEWRVLSWAGADQPGMPAPLGQYLYLLRGRALYQQASAGAVTAPAQWLDRAEADFRKILESDPTVVEAYRYLSKVAAERARLQAAAGNTVDQEKNLAEADRILVDAVKAAGAQPRSHSVLLESRLDRILKEGPDDTLPQRLRSMEPQYAELVRSFDSSAEVLGLAAKFYFLQAYYQGQAQRSAYLDKAVDAARRAADLDKTKVEHVLALAELYSRRAVLLDRPGEVMEARAAARKALDLASVKETSGPLAYANRSNAYGVQVFLAHMAIDQILQADAAGIARARDQWLKEAEEAVHQIGQIIGSGDDPEALKWTGLLALAKGDTDRAATRLCIVQDKAKAAGSARSPDPWVAYVLGRLFMEGQEQGQAARFLAEALRGGVGFSRPSAILDYLEVLGRLEMWTHVTSQANAYNVDNYDRQFGVCPRSRAIRIRALIGTHRIPEAEQEVARLDGRDATTIELKLILLQAKLRQAQGAWASASIGEGRQPGAGGQLTSSDPVSQQLRQFHDQEVELVAQAMEIDPARVGEPVMLSACQTLVEQGKIGEARQMADRYLTVRPQSAAVLLQRAILDEPDPRNVPQARRDALFEQTVPKLTDPRRRSAELISFYQQTGRVQEAVALALKAIDDELQQPGQAADEPAIHAPYGRSGALAAGYVFDVALERKDWSLADQVLDKVRKGDLDGCQGRTFEARLAHARGDFQDALAKMNAALEQRPVFSQGYLLRAAIQDALGRDQESQQDLDRAAQLAPASPAVAAAVANFLFNRNRRLGTAVTEDQRAEAKQALEKAIRLDPSDLGLLTLYAETVRPTEPLKALQIYQIMQRQQPRVETAVAMGTLATDLAGAESRASRKAALLDVAHAAFEGAYAAEPNSPAVVEGYRRYWLVSGQPDKAEALAAQVQDPIGPWQDLARQGKVGQAKAILEQALARDPKRVEALQGLALIAEVTRDQGAVEKYTDALVAARDTAQGRIDQILVLLRSGLVHQGGDRLEQLRTRYPSEPRIALVEAQVSLRQGKLAKARTLVDQVLQAQGGAAEAWLLKGQICLWLGDTDSSIQALNRGKALGDGARAGLILAQAYRMSGRPEDAIAELKPLLSNSSAAWQAAAMLEAIYSRLARTADLADLYSQSDRLFPGETYWNNRAAAFEFSRGDYSKAAQLYARLCKPKAGPAGGQSEAGPTSDADPVAAWDGYFQARIAAAGSSPDSLRVVIREVSELPDSPYKHILQCRAAQARIKLGEGQAAAEDCRRIMQAAGSNPEALSAMARRLVDVLGTEETGRQAEQVLSTDSNSLAWHLAALQAALARKRYDDAVAEVDRCRLLAKQGDPSELAILSQRAQVLTLAYEQTSDNRYLQEGITQYESLLSKMPNHSTVLNNLAYLLAQSGTGLARSLECAKKAYEGMPNSPIILDTYGYVLYRHGRYQEAMELLSAACQQFQIDDLTVPPDVYEHLGMVREAVGEKKEARQAFQQALEVGAGRLSPRAESNIKAALGRL